MTHSTSKTSNPYIDKEHLISNLIMNSTLIYFKGRPNMMIDIIIELFSLLDKIIYSID